MVCERDAGDQQHYECLHYSWPEQRNTGARDGHARRSICANRVPTPFGNNLGEDRANSLAIVSAAVLSLIVVVKLVLGGADCRLVWHCSRAARQSISFSFRLLP